MYNYYHFRVVEALTTCLVTCMIIIILGRGWDHYSNYLDSLRSVGIYFEKSELLCIYLDSIDTLANVDWPQNGSIVRFYL